MGRIKTMLRRAWNIPPVRKAEKSPTISDHTYDILVRAHEQGERLVRMEGPSKPARTGNPFGDILERRVDKGLRNV